VKKGQAMPLGRFEAALEPAAVRRAAALHGTACTAELRKILDVARVDQRLQADGLIILSGLDILPQDDWTRLFVATCSVLGTLLPQSMTEGEQFIRAVRYRGGDLHQQAVRYSDSRAGGSYHNDGVPMPGPLPDLMGLLCVRQAARGGEVVFVEASQALEAATRSMPRLPAVLGREFHFAQRRTDDPTATVIRRIVEGTGGERRLVYLRDYIESGHSLDGVRPLTREEIQAMDVLDTTLHDEALHLEGRLAPGQIVIGDNQRYLHGRHEFLEDAMEDGGRLMLRCWMRRSRSE